VKAAKTRQNVASQLTIDNWDHTLGSIKTNSDRKTDKVATSARSEEFNNRKQHADDDIPQHVHSHLQLQEQLRQVQEDCRGGAPTLRTSRSRPPTSSRNKSPKPVQTINPCETLTWRLWRKTSVKASKLEVEQRVQVGCQHVVPHHQAKDPQ
jgi:hypothetical protein